MVRREADPRWGDAERTWLSLAVERAGHGQQGLVDELVQIDGIDRVSQASASRWISGGTKTPGPIDALLAYSERHAPAGDIRMDIQRPNTHLTIVDTDERDDGPEAATSLDWQLARNLTEELKRAQAQLRAERDRSARLARTIEQLSKDLALVLEGAD